MFSEGDGSVEEQILKSSLARDLGFQKGRKERKVLQEEGTISAKV
jgi:hypothetical protein